MYFNGALSLQPEGLRPITSLSTLDRHGCPYRPKTRYQVRWVTASWAALTAASKHSASWRTTCQYLPDYQTVLLASVPLDNKGWEELEEGAVLALKDGEVLKQA